MTSELKMSFDPLTIEHLGVKMYSHIPNAIAELIANAYDADSHNVHIRLYEEKDRKRIDVADDGIGMDFDDINNKFLRIGRNRRRDGAHTSPSGRKATGKKGLGKLALFGIGDVIEISTIKEGSGKKIKFILNWEKLKATDGSDYKPEFEIEDCSTDLRGTTISLHELRRESPFDKIGLANSLARLFNCFGSDFKCFITLNDDEPINIDNELKFSNIDSQFKWDFPEFSTQVPSEFPDKNKITGRIISSEKPLSPGMRGIMLFAHGRMVNAAEFFGLPESSHVFSYLTGWLNVDFIDEIDEDVISTNRQSLNWELPVIARLKEFLADTLRKVIADWRIQRAEASKKSVAEKSSVDTERWLNTLPPEIKQDVKSVVDSVMKEVDVPTDSQANVISMIHKLIPEYPYYHWRSLHPVVREASKNYYENDDYYTAVNESVKRYIRDVRNAINSTNSSDYSMMGEAYSIPPNRLNVAQKYKRPDGSDFSSETIENIRLGQKSFSESVVQSVRNPLSHEIHDELKSSGFFNEKDCLDALGLISYIYRRLDDAVEVQTTNSATRQADATTPATVE